ncbi:MAG: TonB-dependent receptor plug domain-containing protein [Acidobacteriaceae bacterium]|nr:TonB-dependent receptor plug domain-containing protein [Acidobacteriaceae bacterium]
MRVLGLSPAFIVLAKLYAQSAAEIPQHKDIVSVQATPDPTGPAGGGQFIVGHDDLNNLGTVIANDPFRAVQALPGVTANDDFQAQFSLRGADFNRIGVYLDGVQLHSPIHTLEGTDLSGSESVFNADLIQQLELNDGAYSERFGNSSAGALDIHMRDGDHDHYSFKFMANIASAGLEGAGPLGSLRKCSWIGGFRKTYVQYILGSRLPDPSLAFGAEDGQGRLSCRVTQSNTLALEVIDSYTDLDRSSFKSRLGVNSPMLVNQHSTVENLSWLYTPSDRFFVATHAASLTDNFDDRNPALLPLGQGNYREIAFNSTVTWMWNLRNPLSAGVSMRDMRDTGFLQAHDTAIDVNRVDRYRGTGLLAGGFVEQSWATWKDRLHVNVGGRWDRHSVDNVSAFSPQAAVALNILASTRVTLGWAQHAQYPEISQFGSNLGGFWLLPARSTEVTAGIEQNVGQHTRVRVEVYQRQDRDLLYQPYLDPRLSNGKVFIPPVAPLFENSLRGRARGFEVYVQRSSSKGLTGWVSYAYGHTWMHDGVTNSSFPSDWDQRHTLNAYASYRLRPTLNVSTRWTYGSGFPVPGYFTGTSPNYYLSNERNRLTLGPYRRVDVRINKIWEHESWSTTLYGEVLNATDATNYRFGSLDGYGVKNKLAFLSIDTMFPILPSAGVVFELGRRH